MIAVDAAQQVVAWVVAMADQAVANWDAVSTAMAAGLAVYLAFVLYSRFQSSADPSLRMQKQSGAGSVSVLVSGVSVSVLLVSAIAFLLWPLPVADPFVGAVLVAVVATHYWLEKQEVSMN